MAHTLDHNGVAIQCFWLQPGEVELELQAVFPQKIHFTISYLMQMSRAYVRWVGQLGGLNLGP